MNLRTVTFNPDLTKTIILNYPSSQESVWCGNSSVEILQDSVGNFQACDDFTNRDFSSRTISCFQ